MAIFINEGRPIKIRFGDITGYYWKTLRTGKVIELDLDVGMRKGLDILTTEGHIGKVVVETKQIENNLDFLEELQSIKGIGKKTAKDIYKIYKNRETLEKAIKNGDSIPLRDDIEIKLKDYFHKKKEYGKE